IMGKLIPLCVETAHIVPERYIKDRRLVNVELLTQEEQNTRRDDGKSARFQALLLPEERQKLQTKMLGTQKDHSQGGINVVKDPGAAQQMIYYTETVIAGAQFYWKIALDGVTDLEFEAFCAALGEFARLPYIGGKSGTGHGEISVQFDHWIRIE